MKKLLFQLIIFSTILPNLLYAKQKLNDKNRALLESNNIQVIDSASFFEKLLPSSNKVKYFIVYDNLCVGTPGVFKNIIPNLRLKFGDKIDIFLLSTAPSSAKGIKTLIATLKKYGYNDQVTYFIDPENYNESWKDTREKGYEFRNSVCIPCKEDIIGVPYNFIFDESNTYLSSGYYGNKNFFNILETHFDSRAK